MTEFFFESVHTYGYTYANPGCTLTYNPCNCAGSSWVAGPCNTSGFNSACDPGMDFILVYNSYVSPGPGQQCLFNDCLTRLTSGFFADVASAKAWATATYSLPAGFGSCTDASG